MGVNNSLTKSIGKQKVGFTAYLTQDAVREQINKVVGGSNGDRFIASIISAVQANPALQECSNNSILSAALLGESLKLNPSPTLGNFYMVPYSDKEMGKVAQFQMGYKGYIQLAIRTGQYRKINVLAIKQGELEYFDPLNEDIKVNLMIDNWDAREQAETIGYYAMFELVNGFRKAIYWSKGQMENHALTYSKGYASKKGFTFWEKNFDAMAYKTMLRQLISKWGVMSIELQKAFEEDMAVNEGGNKVYVDNRPEDVVDTEATVVEEPQKKSEPMNPPVDAEDAVQQTLFGGEE